LTDGGVLQGGLVICAAPEDFAASPRQMNLRFLCDQIKLGFANACRYQNAQQLMYTDDLTGLYNHRYMQVALGQESRRAQRYGLKFSLLFLDLDHFKLINDNHGHLAGSAALREVGQLLRDCVRDVDTLFRFGGDEFAALLIEADGASARVVGERIRRTIETHCFLQDQGISARLTVTAGFATYPDDAVELDLLLELADRAMYAGKGNRNIISGSDAVVDSITAADSSTCGHIPEKN
jgi:diguanylate cyclase (GGDEF)-like protein